LTRNALASRRSDAVPSRTASGGHTRTSVFRGPSQPSIQAPEDAGDAGADGSVNPGLSHARSAAPGWPGRQAGWLRTGACVKSRRKGRRSLQAAQTETLKVGGGCLADFRFRRDCSERG
jgi:hypothetical protein